MCSSFTSLHAARPPLNLLRHPPCHDHHLDLPRIIQCLSSKRTNPDFQLLLSYPQADYWRPHPPEARCFVYGTRILADYTRSSGEEATRRIFMGLPFVQMSRMYAYGVIRAPYTFSRYPRNLGMLFLKLYIEKLTD